MAALADKKGVPKPPALRLKGKELAKFSKQLKGWKVVRSHHLEKEYKFKNFLASPRGDRAGVRASVNLINLNPESFRGQPSTTGPESFWDHSNNYSQ